MLLVLQVGQQLRVMKFGDAGGDATKKVDEVCQLTDMTNMYKVTF